MRPFMFDVDFDVDPKAVARQRRAEEEARRRAEEEANAPPPPPTYSEEELHAAVEEARAAGEEAGRGEAYASIEQMTGMTLETIGQQMAHLADSHRKAMQEVNEGAIRLAVAIAKRLVPDLAEREGLHEIEAVARETLSLVRDESRVLITVADTMIETVEPALVAVARQVGFDGTVRVIGDTSLTEGDCRIEWSGGGSERITGKIWEEIETIIARYLGGDDDLTDPTRGSEEPQEEELAEAGGEETPAVADMEATPMEPDGSPEQAAT
ncbi:MAG: FliH/SctL family protein [Alphaproteobacteria bacterium]|nr:FliH/SctL family protein [Alphaproteobacteria bacterium]